MKGPRPPIFQKSHNGMPSELALRICVIRETFEESGVLLLKSFATTSSQLMSGCGTALQGWRERIHDDASKFLLMCRWVLGAIFPCSVLASELWSMKRLACKWLVCNKYVSYSTGVAGRSISRKSLKCMVSRQLQWGPCTILKIEVKVFPNFDWPRPGDGFCCLLTFFGSLSFWKDTCKSIGSDHIVHLHLHSQKHRIHIQCVSPSVNTKFWFETEQITCPVHNALQGILCFAENLENTLRTFNSKECISWR